MILLQQKPLLGELPDLTRFPYWPVALWPFIKSGNLIDLSGNKNTGTLVADTHFVPGKFGSVLDFDGTSDYVEVTDNPSLNFGTGDFTLTAWICPTDISSVCIMSKYTYNDDFEWYLIIGSQQRLYIDGSYHDATATFSAGVWAFVAVTRRNGTIQFYKNGLPDGSTGTLTGSIDNNRPFYIGQRVAGGHIWTGQIGYSTVFDVGLTASQIACLYWHHFPWFVKDKVSQLYIPVVGAAGVMTLNTGYWGPTI